MYKQEPPFTVKVELVEGCPLRCKFCGLSGIRGKKHDYKFMALETASRLGFELEQSGWNVRLEMALRGEPTKHPKLMEMVSIFRQHLPDAYIAMTSNGAGLLRDPVSKVCELFQAGLTTLSIDEYDRCNWADRIRRALHCKPPQELNFIPDLGVDYYEYPSAGKRGNPYNRSKRKRLVFFEPINRTVDGVHNKLNNHTGAGAPLDNSMAGQRCAKPFRELSFRYDGEAMVCCNDWRGQLPIGSIHEYNISGLWQHPVLRSVRKLLYHRRRILAPCRGCNDRSFRVGLLPDKKGKIDLPLPTREDTRLVQAQLEQGPLTVPVLREWEK